MDKPTFFVGRPDGWIQRRPDRMLDVVPFYKLLLEILDEEGYKYTIGGIKRDSRQHDISLAHHTNIARRNVWNIKKGYFPFYLNWDRTGYSGWAEMANSEALFRKTQDVDLDKAREFFDTFAFDYIQKNESKFPQSTELFSVEEPYVFVACQRPRDTVAVWSRVDTLTLAETVVEATRATGYKVVIKRHPKEKQFDMQQLSKYPHVVFSDHSIHQIIPNSDAVFTVNSGVGLEAMLHKKPVYTSGKSDYEWITRQIAGKHDVHEAIRTCQPLTLREIETAIKFFYYMLTEHFVRSDNKESIRKKVHMTVNEWRH